MLDLLSYWNNRVPVNPILIGERIGLEFWKDPKLGFDAGFRMDRGRRVALYRPDADIKVNRLIMGRLLARFSRRLLEEDEILPFPKDRTSLEAMRLLMPDSALEFAIRISEELDTAAKIAEYFHLPEDAARIRMDDFLGGHLFERRIAPDARRTISCAPRGNRGDSRRRASI